MLKCWNHSITTENCAVTYYQTIEWVPWQLGLIKLKKWQKFSKTLKKFENLYKFAFLASGCSSEASHGDGVAPGCWWGWQQLVGGATARLGLGEIVAGVGSKVGGMSSTTKNRSSHHKYKSPKQFELKQSWKALRALNARWALPVYPVFEVEKSKASDKKSVKRKIA